MKKERENKGITLIALIITIIVMLILVGVTVNVALNGGLFDTAKQAASGMEMAQIKEKAEMVKVVLVADTHTDSNVMANVSQYRSRLLEEFGVQETDTDNNNVIEVNDKYGIIIKNTDLDIQVKEISKVPLSDYLTALSYTTSNEQIDDAVISTNVQIKVAKAPITREEYAKKMLEEEVKNISTETKLGAFLRSCNDWVFPSAPEEPLASVDEVIIYGANEYFGTTYTTIEECLEDENIRANWGTTKGALYYGFNDAYLYLTLETSELTEQELLNGYYAEYESCDEYDKYTTNLKLYVSKDGGEEIEIGNNIAIGIYERTYDYLIDENGTYKFILKTENGEEITSEIIQINNIVNNI